MQVALYARVSTERQEQQGTIASQLDALTRWAREQHHDVVDAYVCVDDGYSGARLDRPGLDRLRDGAEAGAFEAALVLCPDRLARKYAYQILILEELERFDVQVIFLDQPLSDDPQARLLTQIQGAVAEYERIKIAERYRRGKLFRARQGEVCWWKVPYGYRRIPRRDGVPAHVEVSEPEAQVVRQIFRWHVDEHLSVRQIALRLTESPHVTATGLPRWGMSTVNRMLHNEAYIGTIYYNRSESVSAEPKSTSRRRRPPNRQQPRPTAEWIPLSVPPIIDADLFRRSQAIHSDNSRFSPRHLKSGHYLLRRVVRCRVCDLAMSCHRMRGRNGTFHYYYYCTGHDVLRARGAVGRCPQRNLRADELDELVWGEVRRHLENPALIREGYARLQAQAASPEGDGLADDLRALEKQLAELDREEHRLLDAYQAGLIDLDQLQERQGRLRQRRAHVNGSIEVLHTERATAQEQAQLQADLETFVDRIRGPLATLDFDARQQLVRTVLERVMVEDGRVDLHFAIPLPEPPGGTTTDPVSSHFRLRSSGTRPRGTLPRKPVQDMTRNKPDHRPASEAVLDTTREAAEQAEKILRPLLTDGKGPVTVTFGYVNEVPSNYVETFFDALMRSAMALGGRRLAIEWMNRLRVQEWAEERAHRTMPNTINLQVWFGILSPPLAVQTGCRAELLEHEQKDADAIARLAVQGIATDSETRKMRQRLIKRIVKTVTEDTQPQTVGERERRS